MPICSQNDRDGTMRVRNCMSSSLDVLCKYRCSSAFVTLSDKKSHPESLRTPLWHHGPRICCSASRGNQGQHVPLLQHKAGCNGGDAKDGSTEVACWQNFMHCRIIIILTAAIINRLIRLGLTATLTDDGTNVSRKRKLERAQRPTPLADSCL